MSQLFLYSAGRLLLVLHGLCAAALCGATIHQTVVAAAAYRGRLRPRLARIYALTSLCLYLATMALGALVYPRYRVAVRASYLDLHAPWASNLFDLKENLATLALPLLCATVILARDLPAWREHGRPWPYLLCAASAALIIAFDTVAGLLCTGVHGI